MCGAHTPVCRSHSCERKDLVRCRPTRSRAEISQGITVEGDPRMVVRTNLVLVRADSPEEAYRKALELGAAGDQSYKNPDGKRATFRLRGLRDLNVMHDELQHGAELIYSEDLDESTIQEWVSPKDSLASSRRSLRAQDRITSHEILWRRCTDDFLIWRRTDLSQRSDSASLS